MKKWLIPLLGLTLALAVTAATGFALAGNGAGTPEPKDSDLPTSSAVCAEEVPDCNDTLVIGPDEEGTIEPDFGEDGPYMVPDRDVVCGPDQGVAITSDGQVSCLGLGDASQTDDGTGVANYEPVGQVVEPQPPVEPWRTITSIDDMDPNECNWIHNINACFSDRQAPADIPMNEYWIVLWLAREDLSQRLAVEIGSIKLAEIERAGWPVYWPEEPEPGMAYIDIALAGFRMVLEADGQTYSYETDTSERVVFVG